MKVGHTGTLDPLASGVLPLVLGRATRLAQFFSGAEKEYEADIELGISTTTFDRAGTVVEAESPRPVVDLSAAEIDAAVNEFRGSYFQLPPAFSAKKIAGDRAYDLARKNEPLTLEPAEVWRVLDLMPLAKQAEVLGYLPRNMQVELARSAPRGKLARIVTEMPSDERADLFNELSERILPPNRACSQRRRSCAVE